MQAWHDYYQMTGGVAATLLGLLFVSVSLNADVILGPGHEHSRRLAEQAFQNYMAVLVISLLVFFPEIAPADFGFVVGSMSMVWAVWLLTRLYKVLVSPRPTESRLAALRRYVPTLAGFGALAWAGWRIYSGENNHQGVVAGALILLLVSATGVAWMLLVNVAAEKFASRK
jgi:hypothetical protein